MEYFGDVLEIEFSDVSNKLKKKNKTSWYIYVLNNFRE